MRWFADVVKSASEATLRLFGQVLELVGEWRDRLPDVRTDAVAHRIVDLLPQHPVVSAVIVSSQLAVSERAAQSALATLAARGVLDVRARAFAPVACLGTGGSRRGCWGSWPAGPAPDRLPRMDVAAALDILGAEDRELALDAEGALNGLTAGEGIEPISQIALQEFLWYRLPAKFLTDDTHKRRLARALGRLLELLELPRYAAMCTSEQTGAVLAAYEDDHEDRGRRVFRSAMAASGVHPVDVDELSWGSVVGVEEAAAFYTVAEALELAIVAGEFTPGARAWKQAQQAVIRQQLLRSQEHLGGASLLDRVLDERVESWITARRGARTQILGPLRPRLCGPTALADDIDRHIGPVRWLLKHADEGLTLTQTHRLKPATVVAMADAFGWDHGIGVRRLEDDVREVVATRELAESIGAVRRRKLQLALTPTGKALLVDRRALWRRLCSTLISQHAYDAAVQELALALMFHGGVVSRGDFAREIAGVMDVEHWRSGDGRSPDELDVNWALVDFHWRLEALSLLEHDPEQPRWQDSWRLNAGGRAAAIEALRARATRPRRSPYEW